MSHHDDDIVTNTSRNTHISDLVEQRLADPARRRTLKGGLGLAALSFIGAGASATLTGCGGDDDAPAPTPAPPPAPTRPVGLGFNAVAKSVADAVTVPTGYTATVLYALGDPIAANVPPTRTTAPMRHPPTPSAPATITMECTTSGSAATGVSALRPAIAHCSA